MSTEESQRTQPRIIGHFSHSLCELDDPDRWAFFVSHSDATVKRLVVFIHGFRGEAVGTWMDFPMIDGHHPDHAWWAEADLLFIGYDSTREEITGIANRIRKYLPKFYPLPFAPIMKICGVPARVDIATPYSELYLVGHSLGGVIARRVLCDVAQEWVDSGLSADKRSPILDARTRFFSPASSGFQPSGWLGLAHATGLWETAIELFLRRSPCYSALKPSSLVLREIHSRTVELLRAGGTELSALRAHILWANPDGVVITERYATDHVDSSFDDKSHLSICKPQDQIYDHPWLFVETGNSER